MVTLGAFNFSRGCANYSKFGGAQNYLRMHSIRVIRVVLKFLPPSTADSLCLNQKTVRVEIQFLILISKSGNKIFDELDLKFDFDFGTFYPI